MDTFVYALQEYFTLTNILFAFLGVTVGIMVGAIPGLTGAMAVAVLTSFTFGMDMGGALAMLLGVYMGAVYGGSISAILVNIPGTSAAVMTGLDGHPMAMRGEGGKAIGIATVSSFIGGIISCLFLVVGCTAIAAVAMKFSYPELFVLAFFGLCVIANASAKSLLHGLVASMLGFLFSLVGIDLLTGAARFTFGIPELYNGIDQVPALIGLFGFSELIDQVVNVREKRPKPKQFTKVFPGWKLIWKLKWVIGKAALIGTGVGALPGAGGPIAAFIAYNEAKNSSKHPEKFGTGIPEGIASCETANNATTGGALIPMLSLAVPGDSVTAILMSAFMIHGVQVGPTIFTESLDVVYCVYIFAILANFIFLFEGLFAAKYFAKILNLESKTLLPLIILVCMIGSFASANTVFNIFVMVFFGVLGYFLKKVDIPPASMILGLVLGELAETNFRSAFSMLRGTFGVFFRPLCLIFWALLVIMVIYPRIRDLIKKRRGEFKEPDPDEPSTLM